MRIVRPKGILSTPKRLRDLAREVGHDCKLSRVDTVQPSRLDFQRDFFLAYPSDPNDHIRHKPPDYEAIRSFYVSTKQAQRGLLEASGIKTPEAYRYSGHSRSGLYVVRPLRHSGGRNYRVTDNPLDFRSGTEYISPLFPKTWEYRAIYYRGTLVLTLLKRVPEDLDSTLPWNHSNGSSFVTVRNFENNRLRHCSVLDDLQNSPVKNAHLVAYDILLSRDYEYCVCEANFCPSLTIPDNLEKVLQCLRSSE